MSSKQVLSLMRNQKLQETAYDKRCQRRICKRSDQPPPKYVNTNNRLQLKADTTLKTFRDTNMTRPDTAGLQQWTAVSSFLGLVSTVYRRHVTPAARASAHKLQNDPFTISSSVLWTHLHPETCVATSLVSGRKVTKCHAHDWCLKNQKINLAG